MSEKEFNLSEKIEKDNDRGNFSGENTYIENYLHFEDVKEFIRLLKEFNMEVGQHSKSAWQRKIEQLAGNKLISHNYTNGK